MSDSVISIGFIGLGKMGGAMAMQLLKYSMSNAAANTKVYVYNRTTAAAAPLVDAGATLVASPAELAHVDVFFTMLANNAATTDCVVDSGLLHALGSRGGGGNGDAKEQRRRRPIHVCCSTLSVAFIEELAALHAAEGVDLLTMPVCGRPDLAAAGKLHLLLAGADEPKAFVRPLVEGIVGQSVRDYGANPVAASAVKIAFNMTLFGMLEVLAEGSALTQRYGVEPEAYIELLTGSLFDCPAVRTYGGLVAGRRWHPVGASLEHVGLKDTRLALEAGGAAGVPLPVASVLRDSLVQAVAEGMGSWDVAAVALVAEMRAGIHRPDGPQQRPPPTLPLSQ